MTRTKQMSRRAATHNGSRMKHKHSIPRRPGKRHNILVTAMLLGSFYGAIVWAIVFALYSFINPFLGGVGVALAAVYVVVFLQVNGAAVLD